MRLPLMMRLMPGQRAQDRLPSPAPLSEPLWNRLQIPVGEPRDRGQKMLARRVQHAADEIERWDLVIRRAAPLEPRHQLRELRRASDEPLRRKELLGDPEMHELP